MLSSLPLLVACFVMGIAARRMLRFPGATSAVLNRVVLDLALPALVLRSIHALVFQRGLLLAPAMMWLQFAGAFVLFTLLGRGKRAAGSAAALTLTAGLCNSAFLGLPLIEGLLGPSALGTAVLVDQLGSFLVLSTVGIAVAAQAAGHDLRLAQIGLRVVRFPPFLALVLALLTRPLAYPAPLLALLARLADLVTPLALISVGFGLELGALRGRGRALAGGLAYKLAGAPLLAAGGLLALGGRGQMFRVAVLQASMAPMVTAGILAAEYDLDPPLASLMVSFGIPLSLLSVPVVAWLLERTGL